MKPPRFHYHDPETVADVVGLLRTLENARVLAGGQSLMPMLNMRLVLPDHVIDLNRVGGVSYIREQGGALEIGAMTRQREIEFSQLVLERCPLMHEAVLQVGHRQTRNRGTLGGSLGHADPAADWISALAALGARVKLTSSTGTRLLDVESFVVSALESALRPGEIIETIHVPARPASAQWGYFKSCRKTGEYAHAIAAVVIDPPAATARLVIGAIEAAPIVIKNPLELFGGRITGDYKERFDPQVADTMLAKAGIADAAQRHIHVNVLKRAIREAAA